LQKYDEIIGERKETFRRRDEENKRFWKRIREEDYYKRRKSEPRINIPDLSDDRYTERQIIEAEESITIETKTDLIPKQNLIATEEGSEIITRRERKRDQNLQTK
jgi:hypothetical protein